MTKNLLHNFSEITVEKPSDKIIRQIRELISSGQLKPGDRLPSERMLCESFGVGRTYVRDAIRKLEFYGILKTLPQSGTVVAGLGITALEGLISDVLELENNDFHSLVETRVLLEVNSARFAAMRRTEEDLIAMQNTLNEYEKTLAEKRKTEEIDLIFHLKIAEASKNAVLKSLMLIVTPDILTNFKEKEICDNARNLRALNEHKLILEEIRNKNPEGASNAMKDHLDDLLEFSTKQINNNNGVSL